MRRRRELSVSRSAGMYHAVLASSQNVLGRDCDSIEVALVQLEDLLDTGALQKYLVR
jgi:hypothetical protein